MRNICEIKLTPDEAKALFESCDENGRNYKPLGLFYTQETNSYGETWWTGIDNTTGHAWTEDFLTLEACVKWLRDETLSADDAEAATIAECTSVDIVRLGHKLTVPFAELQKGDLTEYGMVVDAAHPSGDASVDTWIAYIRRKPNDEHIEGYFPEDFVRADKTPKKHRKFAVVFTYNFDNDCSVFAFNTEDEAREFLKEAYEEELRIETEENGWVVTAGHNDDWSYASIAHHLEDEVDVCEYHMTVIEEGTVS